MLLFALALRRGPDTVGGTSHYSEVNRVRENAIGRANEVTVTLPRYASAPHKEARAPQNLYPIAGLENNLRGRLGNQQILERALRVAAH